MLGTFLQVTQKCKSCGWNSCLEQSADDWQLSCWQHPALECNSFRWCHCCQGA